MHWEGSGGGAEAKVGLSFFISSIWRPFHVWVWDGVGFVACTPCCGVVIDSIFPAYIHCAKCARIWPGVPTTKSNQWYLLLTTISSMNKEYLKWITEPASHKSQNQTQAEDFLLTAFLCFELWGIWLHFQLHEFQRWYQDYISSICNKRRGISCWLPARYFCDLAITVEYWQDFQFLLAKPSLHSSHQSYYGPSVSPIRLSASSFHFSPLLIFHGFRSWFLIHHFMAMQDINTSCRHTHYINKLSLAHTNNGHI